jgi:hypothetical protein
MVSKKQFDNSLVSTTILKSSDKLAGKIKWNPSESNNSTIYTFCFLEKMESLCKLNPVSLSYIPILDLRNKIQDVESIGNRKIIIRLLNNDQLIVRLNEILLFKLLKLKDINYSREDLNFGDVKKEHFLRSQKNSMSASLNKMLLKINKLNSQEKHIFVLYIVIGVLLLLLIFNFSK